jgi:hypothetical protein
MVGHDPDSIDAITMSDFLYLSSFLERLFFCINLFSGFSYVEQALSNMWAEQKTQPWRCPMPNYPEFTGWRCAYAYYE